MAKPPGDDDEMLNPSTVIRGPVPEPSNGDVNMEPDDGATAVSLEEILKLYNQPINEEQAWAVCYQCCRTLAQIQRRKSLKSAGASAIDYPRRIEGAGDVMIGRDGTVKLHFNGSAGKPVNSSQILGLTLTFVLIDILDFFFFGGRGLFVCTTVCHKWSITLAFIQGPDLWSILTEAILLWLSASSHVVDLFTDAQCGY